MIQLQTINEIGNFGKIVRYNHDHCVLFVLTKLSTLLGQSYQKLRESNFPMPMES